MRLLQFDEIDDRAEVIAEMQITGRLDARKNPFHECHCQLPAGISRAFSSEVDIGSREENASNIVSAASFAT
jgi:hypothetical protein